MHKLKFTIVLLLSLGLFSGCGEKIIKNDEATTQAVASPDRNMFGLRIPRGVAKTSDNLVPGYVLFAVPNSSLMYLVNRKGEVVHQWKSDKPVSGGYLGNDGSIIQMAVDPDFPCAGLRPACTASSEDLASHAIARTLPFGITTMS